MPHPCCHPKVYRVKYGVDPLVDTVLLGAHVAHPLLLVLLCYRGADQSLFSSPVLGVLETTVPSLASGASDAHAAWTRMCPAGQRSRRCSVSPSCDCRSSVTWGDIVTLTRCSLPSGVQGRLRAKSSSSSSVLHDSNRRHVCQWRPPGVSANRAAALHPRARTPPTHLLGYALCPRPAREGHPQRVAAGAPGSAQRGSRSWRCPPPPPWAPPPRG